MVNIVISFENPCLQHPDTLVIGCDSCPTLAVFDNITKMRYLIQHAIGKEIDVRMVDHDVTHPKTYTWKVDLYETHDSEKG